MQSRWIDYVDGQLKLKAYWAAPEGSGTFPTVIVVHTFRGLTPSIQGRAARLAENGYAACAIDIFGPGIRPVDQATALATIKPFQSDRPMFRQRLKAGFEATLLQPECDRQRVAAIGYCFGGSGVLEMARSGLDLRGVVSLHGEFATSMPAQPGAVRAKVLALHGAGDIIVKRDAVDAFQDELRRANVDWEFVSYANAMHSFTGEGIGTDADPTAKFDAQAETRSWKRQGDFLREVLGHTGTRSHS
jgi:dienelactone hydrolase